MSNDLPSEKQLFYLSGRTIHKRPASREEGGKTVLSVGFPVCTVSQWADPKELLRLLNESAK